MKLRSKLSYSNVVATLALFLVLTGGTVYAASQLGKNDVKSKNIAKGAVKGSDIAKNAVTGKKVKDGQIGTSDLAADVLSKLQADVTGSATGGVQGGLTTNTAAPYPLAGTTTFTPGAGEVTAIAAEVKFSIATTNIAQNCQPDVRILANGQPTRLFITPETGEDSTTLVSAAGRDAAGPYGLTDPGTPIALTAEYRGDPDCTATSQIERTEIRILQIK